MTHTEVELLLKKYRLGLCTDEEKKVIEDWYDKRLKDGNFEWAKSDKENFKYLLDQSILPAITDTPSIPFYRKAIFRYTVAAVFLGILIGTFFFLNHSASNTKDWTLEPQLARYQNDINPGKSGAVWSINNKASYVLEGKNKVLNGLFGKGTANELVFDSTVDTKGQYFENTISTQNGQQYKVVLSDGTKVWINAASSIHFKMPFDKNKREIFLTGEAYFEVAHDAKKPFIVISDNDSITVLGTHFNINSYKDEPQYTATLLEGSIQYNNAAIADAQHILKPNEVLIRTAQGINISSQDDAENRTAWKDGYFSFSNDDIHTVMRQLSRWYNIQVKYGNSNYKEKFYGDLRKDAPLSSILSVLEKSGVKFLIQGSTVTVL
ncbi:MAG: hypothetical protein DI598_00670 [Pseudopedobacter saltans]|uniref:Anti-FecI sigma factor, FecR n=1 Tax=Pseudopedobacter saltans TaxID=151895 RepID=A0A2W5FAQ3_9SPHI|nr:MAG: hypothetical protein DI598_00670 [Pseudopedobacter saltans]